MSKIGIYPGTFDPITHGHIDVIKRSLKIVNKLIVAVSNDYSKDYLFSAEERVLIIKNSLFKDLKFNRQNIKVLSFNTLTTSLCAKYNATVIIRGLRAVSDFEYEFQMAQMNRELDPSLEFIFLTPDARLSFLSASLVREVARLGGDVSPFVSPSVLSRLTKRFDPIDPPEV